jgi:uncharacterized protein YbbC (DUF1343 family)
MKLTLKIASVIFISLLTVTAQQNKLILGNQNLLENHFDELRGKRIALVINQTSQLPNGTSLLDTLTSLRIKIPKVFSLEHGLLGKVNPGKSISNYSLEDSIQVVSLYGKKKSPTIADLNNIDIIIYDIQDVGTRFYTYISSLYLIMKSVSQTGKPIYVLDRPNPQCRKVTGQILNKKYSSFVGITEIPVTFGMSIGELSLFFKDKIKVETGKDVNLHVIKMLNYSEKKSERFFRRKWIPPSPNLRNLNSALLYPGLCFLEATNISEGRGTKFPFEIFGAPFIKSEKIISLLKPKFPKLQFSKIIFIPKSTNGFRVKHRGEKCNGVKIKVVNSKFNAVLFGVELLKTLSELYPDKIEFNYSWLLKLYGNANLQKYLEGKIHFISLKRKIETDEKIFINIRRKYLIY